MLGFITGQKLLVVTLIVLTERTGLARAKDGLAYRRKEAANDVYAWTSVTVAIFVLVNMSSIMTTSKSSVERSPERYC